MVVIEQAFYLPYPLKYICRGEHGCGTPLTAADKVRHYEFHVSLGAPVAIRAIEDVHLPGDRADAEP